MMVDERTSPHRQLMLVRNTSQKGISRFRFLIHFLVLYWEQQIVSLVATTQFTTMSSDVNFYCTIQFLSYAESEDSQKSVAFSLPKFCLWTLFCKTLTYLCKLQFYIHPLYLSRNRHWTHCIHFKWPLVLLTCPCQCNHRISSLVIMITRVDHLAWFAFIYSTDTQPPQLYASQC